MNFLNNKMQSVRQYKYLLSYTESRYLSELLWKLCLHGHTPGMGVVVFH